VRAVGIEPTLL